MISEGLTHVGILSQDVAFLLAANSPHDVSPAPLDPAHGVLWLTWC